MSWQEMFTFDTYEWICSDSETIWTEENRRARWKNLSECHFFPPQRPHAHEWNDGETEGEK
jgi:hypothetical protein